MIKSRLIRLYISLSKTELRQFKLWINSPIHNQHRNVIKLFNFLASKRKITATSVQRKRAFNAIFPTENYQEEKLRHLMNYALTTLKDFVGYNQYISKAFESKKNIAQALRQRNMLDLVGIELDKLTIQTENLSLKNAQTSLQHFELESEYFKLEGIQSNAAQTNLPNIFEHLTDFYALSMLKYACITQSQGNVTKANYNSPVLEAILPIIKEQPHPVFQLYFNLYLSLKGTKDNNAHFEQARSLFFNHSNLLNKEEQHEVLLLLINYCIKKRLDTDSNFFIKIGFECYRWGLENNILIQHNLLSRFAYMNIVGMGLKLKEFDWVANFILQYAVFLPLQFQENYQHYATAKLLFKQKKYTQTQRLLSQVEYDYIFLNLDAKTTLLEIYYEEKSWDALEALLISFSRYLQRKQVIAYHKQVYQNIILLTRKLMMLAPYDKKAKKILIQEIKTTNPLAERDWLLKQVDLL